MDVSQTTLPNGIRLVTSTIPRVESATVGLWVGVGARHEPKRISGISHFIEHLLFKGTKKRTAKKISQDIEGYGGYLNAFTQEENTCYYAHVVRNRLKNTIDVLSDMYLNSRFSGNEIERERGVIIEEIMMYRDQPSHVVEEMLSRALWLKHPMGIPIIGTPRTVMGITRKDILGYFGKHYRAGNTVVAVAGNLDHDECARILQDSLASRSRGSGRKFQPVTSAVKQDRTTLAKRDIKQAQIAMGVRLFGRRDSRRHSLRVLNAVLGEAMSSRLFQVVREKHGLAYSIHSSCHLYHDTGALVISGGLDRKRTDKAILLILKELAKLRDKPVGTRELKLAREYVLGHIKLGLESTTHHMMWLGDNIMSHNKFISPKEVIDKLMKITPSDVQALARTIFTKSRMTVAMVSPDIDKDTTERYMEMIYDIL